MAIRFGPEQLQTDFLKGRKIAVIGYGNQGRTHALNLRDQGLTVLVGAREGKGREAAVSDGFSPLEIPSAVGEAEVVVMALSDVPMGAIYHAQVAPLLMTSATLVFVHGFNIVHDLVHPPHGLDVVLVSPKGSGHSLRQAFLNGMSLPALIAVHQNPSGGALKTALAYAAGIGCRELAVETTFREETETDLFGEQVVLCGGIPELIEAAFKTLLEAGYQPETAYFECVYEAKLIIDLLLARGLNGMREAISDTAEWGGYTVGPKVINEESRRAMREALDAIRDGSFARKWLSEAKEMEEMSGFREESRKNAIDPVWSSFNGR